MPHRLIAPLVLVLAAALAAPSIARAQYARIEGLQWRLQEAPIPVPLLTTTNGSAIGTVGDPNTQILLGSQVYDLGLRSGPRVTVGAWFDPGETFGVEASGFYLEQFGTNRVFFDPSGSFRFGMPYFDAVASLPAVYPLSSPPFFGASRTIFIPESERRITIPGAILPGSTAVVGFATRSQLQGFDANGMIGASADFPVRLELLGGFRYLHLKEDLLLLTTSTAFPDNGNVFTTSDSFKTRNSFYGGQAGARLIFDGGIVFAELAGKVAAGPMVEQVDVTGSFSTTAFDPLHNANVFPGAVYAQRTNLGSTTSTRFAVVSEAQANAGVQFGPVRAFVGYSFMYVTSVARPGNQIDPSINPNQSEAISLSASPTGVGAGPFLPARTVNSSPFWAQGVSLGLELRY